MSKKTNKDDTEEIIKKTAKSIFFSQGRFGAKTQEIADEAGVNRSLINYYFRSRDNLLDIVFQEAQVEQLKKSNKILFSELGFYQKIDSFIEIALAHSIQYPYLDIYLVMQINQGCLMKDQQEIEKATKVLDEGLKKEIALGNIHPIDTQQFILNLISLIAFPSCMRPIFQKAMNISNEQYLQLIADRKEIILELLFKKQISI